MPTEGVGAIGSLDCSAEERKRMAVRYVGLPALVQAGPRLSFQTPISVTSLSIFFYNIIAMFPGSPPYLV